MKSLSLGRDFLTYGLLCVAACLDGCLIQEIATAYEVDAFTKNGASSGDDHGNGQCFVADSGATAHCCNDASLFIKFHSDRPKTRIRVANGKTVPVTHIGDVKLNLRDKNGTFHSVILRNVLYVPEMPVNLLSVKRLWKDNRIKAKFRDNLELKDLDNNRFVYDLSSKHYYVPYYTKLQTPRSAFGLCVDIDTRTGVDTVYATADVDVDTLHAMLGHIHSSRISLLRERATGLPTVAASISISQFRPDCDACEQGGRENL